MEHRLVHGIQKALGWSGPEPLGSVFARGSLPELALCARLLTPTKLLDLVMRRSLSTDGLRCLVNGVDLHPRSYLGLSPARRGQPVPMADMQRIGRLLQSGCTLILDMAHFFDPTLEVACRALQWWSSELVQVNLYLTTGEAAGFELHWDDHDVIVVQLAGEKSWEVRGLSRPAPMYRDAVPNPDPPDDIVWTGTMQAGDVMHIPRGYWHQATRADRGDGFSLHATFGFSKRTGVDYLNWLADHSREIELFRHDLDRWGVATDRAAQQLALTDEAVRLVATRSVAEYLAARAQDRPAARHVATHDVFGPPMAVVCCSEFPPAVLEHDDTVVVSAAGRTVTFAAAAQPALRLLLSGRPVVVSALAASTGLDIAPVVQVLVEQGICAELTAELDVGYADWVS
jgi:hypothetical protein